MTIHDHYKRKSLAYKAASALLYDHSNGLDFTQKRLTTELQKSLYYQTYGLKKTINKELEKNEKSI